MRIATAGVYVTLAGYAAWVTVSRWNLKPARIVTPAMAKSGHIGIHLPPIDPTLVRTSEINTTIASLPPLPPVTLPPLPRGTQWSEIPKAGAVLDVSLVTLGPWTPERRPYLAAAIEYLTSPPIEAAMARIDSLKPGGYRGSDFRGVRQLARCIAGRARILHAEHRDIKGAVDEIARLFRLTRGIRHSNAIIGHLVTLACDALAFVELANMFCEHDISPSELQYVLKLYEAIPLDVEDHWLASVDAMFLDCQAGLETAFASDKEGGSLVLSQFESLTSGQFATSHRSGIWNTFSIFYNDRSTVQRKLTITRDQYEGLAGLSMTDALQRIASAAFRSPFNVTDGPMSSHFSDVYIRFFLLEYRKVQSLRATLITAALSAHKADTGTYPQSLQKIRGSYLESIPDDPFTGSSFTYSTDGATFELGSTYSREEAKSHFVRPLHYPTGRWDRALYEPVLEDAAP